MATDRATIDWSLDTTKRIVPDVLEILNAGERPASHPLADLFPLLPDDGLRELADDIKAANVVHATVLLDQTGRIVDGRNRVRAVLLVAAANPGTFASEDPHFNATVAYRYGDAGHLFIEFEVVPDAEIASRIIGANLARRHLSTKERAELAAKFATLPQGGAGQARNRQNLNPSNDGLRNAPAMTVAEAATAFSVSPSSVERAQRRQRPPAPPAASQNVRVEIVPHPDARPPENVRVEIVPPRALLRREALPAAAPLSRRIDAAAHSALNTIHWCCDDDPDPALQVRRTRLARVRMVVCRMLAILDADTFDATASEET